MYSESSRERWVAYWKKNSEVSCCEGHVWWCNHMLKQFAEGNYERSGWQDTHDEWCCPSFGLSNADR